MKRIQRSFHLMVQAYRVIMQDKELLVLPALSGICILVVGLSFLMPIVMIDGVGLENAGETTFLVLVFVFYVITYTISFFFQAAIIAGASERMAGGNPTLGSALGAAAKRIGPIFVWGLIAATVGLIIRTAQNRSEVVGKIIMGVIGVSWTLTTFFMVPVLVMEELPIGGSFRKSWDTFKKTWGETVAGNIGLGLAGFLCAIPIIAICALLISAEQVAAAIIFGGLALAILSVFFSALQGVWVAAVYRYATTGEAPSGFDTDAMQGAFGPK